MSEKTCLLHEKKIDTKLHNYGYKIFINGDP